LLFVILQDDILSHAVLLKEANAISVELKKKVCTTLGPELWSHSFLFFIVLVPMQGLPAGAWVRDGLSTRTRRINGKKVKYRVSKKIFQKGKLWDMDIHDPLVFVCVGFGAGGIPTSKLGLILLYLNIFYGILYIFIIIIAFR
jgi:hypothetical protein